MDSAQSTQSQKPLDLAPIVGQIVDKRQVSQMLCYGDFSKFWGTFRASHRVEIESFNESIIGCDRPFPSELVVSLNYLNTVGFLRIKDVLDELRRLTMGIGFFHVSQDEMDPKDTRQPVEWWLAEFVRRFSLQTFQRIPGGFYVIVYPKGH
jgi:hypothetical protein